MPFATPAQEKYLRFLIISKVSKFNLKQLHGAYYSNDMIIALCIEGLCKLFKLSYTQINLGWGGLDYTIASTLIKELKNWQPDTVIIPGRYSIKIFNKSTYRTYEYSQKCFE
jgi:hypothetical protein